MKILSLDFGARRIGVAIADGRIVASLPVIESKNREGALKNILKIIRDENIEKIVLGLPQTKLSSGGSEDMIRSFAMEINRLSSIPVEFVDEPLTSKEAERILKDVKIDPKSEKYKQEIDRISAKLILEQYLRDNA